MAGELYCCWCMLGVAVHHRFEAVLSYRHQVSCNINTQQTAATLSDRVEQSVRLPYCCPVVGPDAGLHTVEIFQRLRCLQLVYTRQAHQLAHLLDQRGTGTQRCRPAASACQTGCADAGYGCVLPPPPAADAHLSVCMPCISAMHACNALFKPSALNPVS